MMFLKSNLPVMLGMILGAIGGFLYYRFVGCNGSCMIASSPYISTLYGAVMGGLSVNLFRSGKAKEKAA